MLRSLFILSVIVLFSACKQIDKLTQFEMNFEQSIVVPSAVSLNLPFDIITPDISSNSTATYELNNTNKDLIESVMLRQLNLELTGPNSSDLSFLNSVEIYLNAEGLSELRIAWKENISDDVGNFLALETTENDLQAYISKDKFELRVQSVTDKLITSDHSIDIKSVFFVDAKILGI